MFASASAIYVVAAVIAIAIGWLLFHLSGLSSQAKLKEEARLRGENPSFVVTSDEGFKNTVTSEISGIVGSGREGDQIGRKVLELFDRELEKKMNIATQEIGRKYEATIEQKVKAEEIAWEKYKKTLGEKKQTEAVIRSIADGLVVVDSQGKVVMMNPAAEKLLGLSRKDKIGKPLAENLKEEQLISLSKGSGDKEDREIELISKLDETKKVLRASTAVVENEDGKTVGMVSVLSDVTKQKELDELKSKFVASVSHELRTPLVAIEKSISLILTEKKSELSAADKELLTIAERNLKRLAATINDILDFSKLEAGKMEIHKSTALIENIIDEAMAALATWAHTKSIAIEKKIDKNLPSINVDAMRIGQIFNNLVGNALKFTPSGGKITIEALLRQDKRLIEISVKDTGAGISNADLHGIFQKFYQTGTGQSGVSGTGLGLSIAKEIVELHGGSIWVESEKGEGAKFIFTIPLS